MIAEPLDLLVLSSLALAIVGFFSRKHGLHAGIAALIVAWAAVAEGFIESGPQRLFYPVLAVAPTLSLGLYLDERLEEELYRYAPLTGVVIAGSLIAVKGFDSPIYILVGLETTVIASYAILSLPGRKKDVSAALLYFIAGTLSVILVTIGLIAMYGCTGCVWSLALFWTGVSLELAIAPFYAWGVQVVEWSTTYTLLPGLSAPKIALLAIIALNKGFFIPAGMPREITVFIAALSVLVGGLGALREWRNPRLPLAYGTVLNTGLALFLLSSPITGVSVLAYYLAVVIVEETGFLALIQTACGPRECPISGESRGSRMWRIVVALMLGALVGVPPFSTLLAKIMVFAYSMTDVLSSTLLIATALPATAFSAYYYVRSLTGLLNLSPKGRNSLLISIVSILMLVLLVFLFPMSG